jgi:2-octaprenyl-6-methoxyphenol hydroxylase
MAENLVKADVVIAGGGPVGLALAAALGQAAPQLSLVLVDDKALGHRDDARASAIAAAAKKMLERLGVWSAVESSAQPITEMIVTDSSAGDVVRGVPHRRRMIDDGSPSPIWCRTPAGLRSARPGGR